MLAMLAALAIGPWLLPTRERVDLNDAVRARLSRKCFARLSGGVTHFEWAGPEHGPKVVLVHGFSSPFFIWDRNFDALARAAFRVLRYDLFGRGLSERPHRRYDEDLFDRQLLDLLDSQGITEPVDLVGLSMGGAITVHFLDRHPDRVAKVALFAPAGMMRLPGSSRLLTTPGLGAWILRAFGDRLVMDQMPRGLTDDPETLEAFRAAYADQLQYKGYKRALVRTMRDYDLGHMDAVYQRVGRQQRKGLLFWGDRDGIVEYALHERVCAYMPWLEFVPVPGGGHAVPYEDADAVTPRLIAFLREG